MIRIPLKLKNKQGILDVDPVILDWDRQNAGAEYCMIKKTNLLSPFEKVFIKKWIGRQAPGHGLMLSYQHIGHIAYTPSLLGYKDEGNDHYYVMQMLRDVKNLDYFTSKQNVFADLLQPDFVLQCLKTIISSFSEINKRGYYYPDLCYKNIMANLKRQHVYLIDIDSCLPKKITPSKARRDYTFSQTWWQLYHSSPHRSENENPTCLNQTMAISFALVWCYAMAWAKSRDHVKKALEAKAKDNIQKDLFEVFDNRDKAQLRAKFNIKSGFTPQMDIIFENWHNIMKKMEKNEPVDWEEDVYGFVRHLWMVIIHRSVIPGA